ncbi:hypothetical protein SISSUDRAFT_1047930 [Sistotremastrum suecicum HHB10207 ss-3]|uniref:Uncharacterized protein n=1 Tax=Sistotremastrum suecicum HHB10207 ss-3 TaxID=1314776 RepID=A0A166CUZ0_9AGAM|nr:hypothetical protein SISSUDRAFT_1047930 [Sistotremastrum suecicum HHB10207 ss-3]
MSAGPRFNHSASSSFGLFTLTLSLCLHPIDDMPSIVELLDATPVISLWTMKGRLARDCERALSIFFRNEECVEKMLYSNSTR